MHLVQDIRAIAAVVRTQLCLEGLLQSPHSLPSVQSFTGLQEHFTAQGYRYLACAGVLHRPRQRRAYTSLVSAYGLIMPLLNPAHE